MTSRDTALPSPRNRVGFTPSFDGVLNGGDSWVARRRASETSLKSVVGASRDQEHQLDSKALEIREEEEDGSHQLQSSEHVEEKLNVSDSHSTSTTAASQPTNNAPQDSRTVGAGMPITANGSEPVDNPMANGPPPGIPDLASIEWSYKDPSGQVQGM